MKKDEFLSILEKRLQIINEKERRDIIDEYRMHIEMKMQEGKSEEEAIADFGDIDELVEEILDAYSINTKRMSSEGKLNRFLDELFDGCRRLLASFTSLEMEDVVRLLFEIIVIFFLLLFMKIPFSIVSSLGEHLLEELIGFGIGSLLGHIWELLVEISYVVIFIALLVSMIQKRLPRYRHPHKNDTKAQGRKERRQQTIYDRQEEHAYEEGKEEEGYREETTFAASKSGVAKIAAVLMKIFFGLLMLPLLAGAIALCCMLAVMIVLSIQGVTLFGAYFIVIGALFLLAAFLSLFYRLLWRKGS